MMDDDDDDDFLLYIDHWFPLKCLLFIYISIFIGETIKPNSYEKLETV